MHAILNGERGLGRHAEGNEVESRGQYVDLRIDPSIPH